MTAPYTDPVLCDLHGLYEQWREPDEAMVGHIPKNNGKAVDFLSHAIVTRALLECDPQWNWEPLAFDERGLPAYDNAGGLWIKLTVRGTTRLGYGQGATPKHRISDALKVAAMRFGVALSLWARESWESLDEDTPAAPDREADHDTPVIPAGWGSLSEHDEWRAGVRSRGARLPLDLQGEFAGWWRKSKWKWPLTKVQADEYEARLAELVAKAAAAQTVVDVPTGGLL